MKQDSHEFELLSAYLDNEVSAGEQAEVEQLLESDPQARHVLDQISQMGDLLRAQPQQQVRSSFAASVMQQVRQQPAHAGGHATATASASDPASQQAESPREQSEPTHVSLPPSAESHSPTGRFTSTYLWGILAAAAALLLLAYPLGLFSHFDNVDANRMVEGENRVQPEEELVEGSGNNLPPNNPIAQPAPENRVAPEVRDPAVPEIPQAPPPSSLVNDPPALPDTIVPVPGVPNTPSPFVGNSGFTAEEEKMLRLLESLVLVKIECTPPTAKTSEFEKILKKHKIKVAEKATPKRPANAPPPTTEVFYIEASSQQAEAVLNEVSGRSNEFTSMTMRTETLPTKNALNAEAPESDDTPSEKPAEPGQPEEPARVQAPDAEQSTTNESASGRGSFAEKFYLETPEEIEALRNQQAQPMSASNVLPFLQGESDLDAILGASPVDAEHLVRMLVVLDTVEPKKVD